MSKFIDNLSMEMTGLRKMPRPGPVTCEVKGVPPRLIEFNEMEEYVVKTEYIIFITCLPEEKDHMLKRCQDELRHMIYGEFIDLLLEMDRAVYSQDDRKIKDILGDIHSLIH